MKRRFIIAGLLACFGIATQAQDVKTEEPKADNASNSYSAYINCYFGL